MRRPNRRPNYTETEDIQNWEIPPDYIIYKDDADTVAVNGDTGKEDSRNTDSATVIQYAFDNVPSGDTGNVVIKNAGSIYAISKVITIPDDLCCIIQGSLKLDNGVDDSMFQNEDYASNTANDNITFIGDGGYIDLNKANQTAGSAIEGCFTNSRFEGLRIENCFYHAIHIVGHSEKVIVTKCMFKTLGASGVQCHWDTDDDAAWNDVTITDNIFDDCAKIAYPSGAIWLSGGDNAVVANNHLINTDAGVAIQIYNGDNTIGLSNVIVKGNVIDGGKYGIMSYSCGDPGSYIRNVTIDSNVIKDSNEYGIFLSSHGDDLENYIISHNQIYNTAKDGIYLERIAPNGVGISHVLIDGNIIDLPAVNYRGINLTSTYIHDVVISNNIVRGVTGNEHGIISYADDVVITGNFVDVDCGTGLYVGDDNTIISNNIVKNDGTQCIYVSVCDNILVDGNYCSGTSKSLVTVGIINGIRILHNCFKATGQVWDASGAHNDVLFRNNIGQIRNNQGSTAAKDGSDIPHGCVLTPYAVSVTASVQGHIATVSGLDSTNITIDLVDHAGNPIAVNETIYWTAWR